MDGEGNNGENDVPAPAPAPAPELDGQVVLGRQTSDVWADFTKVWYKGEVKAQCNHYKKYLAGHSSHGTSHLRNHLTTCLPKKIKDGTQKVL
ncbi:hypothetical protein LINGRAHAP2_LOCUS14189 [Linum grandiflorum]